MSKGLDTSCHTDTLSVEDSGKPPRGGLPDVALIYFATLALAVILTPIFYSLVKFLHPEWSKLQGANAEVLMTGFDRVFSRIRMVSALLLLPWLLRRSGITSWKSLGLGWNRENGRLLLKGWMIGVAMLGTILTAQFLALSPIVKDKASPDELNWWLYALGSAVMTALLVSAGEEILFRGYLQKVFQSRLGKGLGLVAVSLVFASLHFRNPPPDWNLGVPGTWSCAFNLAIGQSVGFLWTAGAAHFVNLTLAGLCLGLFTWRTGSLWPAIGLHAGWILVRSVYLQGWRVEPSAAPGLMESFWGTTSLVNGWAATAPLLALGIWLAVPLLPKRP